MTRIGLLSDTHSYFDKQLETAFLECNEIWHAGDFGNESVFTELQSLGKPIRGVYGNIDGQAIRKIFPEISEWMTEDVKISMKHIGGYPGHYPSFVKGWLKQSKPGIFICGHSHILKIIYDKELDFLHLNPGACGKEGFHQMRTVIRFTIDGSDIRDMEVVELGKR
jgi:putative phosphoesterase